MAAFGLHLLARGAICDATMATRSRTALFCKYRDSLKTHRKTPLRGASGMLVEGRQTKNLLSALSDDESSAIDARAYAPSPRRLVDDRRLVTRPFSNLIIYP